MRKEIEKTRQRSNANPGLIGALVSFLLFAPCAAHPVRVFQAAECTMTEVTARVASCYDTIRFVYQVQHRSEQIKAAQ